MIYEDASNEANRIVEEMYFSPDGETRKFLITAESQEMISELREMAVSMPWLKCFVTGIAESRKKWLVLSSPRANRPGGELIVVDFKARTIIREVA
jgi:hypothetical protein